VFGQVDLLGADTQNAGHLRHWPVLQNVEIEYLILPSIDQGNYRARIQIMRDVDCDGSAWESSHMTTLVRADEKGRICIRGTRKGQEYLVRAEKSGWWVTPVAIMRSPKQRREWAGSKKSLADHLSGLADSGLRIEQADNATRKVGRYRF
jgi:hypothetical protein